MDEIQKSKVQFSVFAPCSYDFKYSGKENYLSQIHCFNKYDRILFYYKYNKVYNALIKNENIKQYDLLHAHSLFANGYIAYRIYKDYSIPYIVAIRNTDINIFFKYFINLRKLGLNIINNASKVIFISNSYKKNLLNKYIPYNQRDSIERKCIVIPNGIDDYFLNNKSKNKTFDGNNLNLVYTGSIDNNKNLMTTIKCCNKILKNKYHLQLTVMGNIVSKKYKYIFDKYHFIEYLGSKNKEEIKNVYRNMNIFVMPSRHETFGLTYVEAMSQGIPVIYTKNEGFDGFFSEGTVGYHMKYNDYKEMAQKIEMILKDYTNISKNCVQKSSEFNWHDIALKYIKIYEESEHNKK
jgi:glycosyltransferase involved in cell wall biosynthesis